MHASFHYVKQTPPSSDTMLQQSENSAKHPASSSSARQHPTPNILNRQSSSRSASGSSAKQLKTCCSTVRPQSSPRTTQQLPPVSTHGKQPSLRDASQPLSVSIAKPDLSISNQQQPFCSTVIPQSLSRSTRQPPSVKLRIDGKQPSSSNARQPYSVSSAESYASVSNQHPSSSDNRQQPTSNDAKRKFPSSDARMQPSFNKIKLQPCSSIPQRTRKQPNWSNAKLQPSVNNTQQSTISSVRQPLHRSDSAEQQTTKLSPYLLKDQFVTAVAKKLGRDWKEFASQLGLTYSEIENVELENYNYGTKQMIVNTMEKWRRREGEEATETKLIEHLKAIDRQDVANDICSLSSQNRQMTNLREHSGTDQSLLELKEVQDKLSQQFKALQMRGLPWMRNVDLSLQKHFVQLDMTEENGIKHEKRKLELTELFNGGTSCKRPSRILIEGHAGHGKTATGAKLCFDFCNRENYMAQFDLVLFYAMKNFHGSLENMFFDAANCETEKQRDVLTKLLSNEAINTLIIMDGFDEMPGENAESVLALFRRELFPHITVVVTSRPGMFSSSSSSRFNLQFLNLSQDVGVDLTEMWDKHVKLNGICEGSEWEFLEKHLSNLSSKEKEDVELHLESLKRSDILPSDLIKCPLFFLMIVLLLTGKEDLDLQLLMTRTALYKGLMNFVMRRYLAKLEEPCATTADLFSSNNTNRTFYVDMVTQFGEFSIDTLNANKLSFSRQYVLGPNSCNDSGILDLGILFKTILVKGPWEMECYEPVHKSLMEFPAAYFLWTQYISGVLDQWKATIYKFRPIFASFKSSLVLPFLAGLIGNQSTALFDVLLPYAYEYSCHFANLVPTLTEIEMTELISASLSPFFPPCWKISPEDPFFPYELMLKGVELLKIKVLEWCLKYPVKVMHNMKVEWLVLTVGDNLSAIMESQFERVKCNHLLLVFQRSSELETVGKDLLLHLLSIQFECVSFRMWDHTTTSVLIPLIHDAAANGKLQYANIHCIHCSIKDRNVLDLLNDLIQKERINALCIMGFYLEEQADLDSLLKHISKSSTLTKFKLEGTISLLTVNLAHLWDAGEKSYAYVNVWDSMIEFSNYAQERIFETNFLELYYCDCTESVIDLLRSCRVSAIYGIYPILKIDSPLLQESLNELAIHLDDIFFREEHFKRLHDYRNLRVLTLLMPLFESELSSVDKWLLEAMQQMPFLQGIAIEWVERNFLLAREIVDCISLMYRLDVSSIPEANQSFLSPVPVPLAAEKLPLQYLSVSYDSYSFRDSEGSRLCKFFEILSCLKQLLIRKALLRLDIIAEKACFLEDIAKHKPNDCSSLVDVFSVEENFVVEYDFVGLKTEDSIYDKELFFPKVQSYNDFRHRFSVSLNRNKK